MNENRKSHHLYGESDNTTAQQAHSPFWKRAHRDWRVWVAVLLMIAGMVVYVMSEDLTFRPRGPSQKSSAIGK